MSELASSVYFLFFSAALRLGVVRGAGSSSSPSPTPSSSPSSVLTAAALALAGDLFFLGVGVALVLTGEGGVEVLLVVVSGMPLAEANAASFFLIWATALAVDLWLEWPTRVASLG